MTTKCCLLLPRAIFWGIRTNTHRTNTHRTYTPGQIPTGQLPPLQNTPWTYTHQFFYKIKILNKYTLLFLTFHLVVGICPEGILQGEYMSGGYMSGGYMSGGYLSGGICPRIIFWISAIEEFFLKSRVLNTLFVTDRLTGSTILPLNPPAKKHIQIYENIPTSYATNRDHFSLRAKFNPAL